MWVVERAPRLVGRIGGRVRALPHSTEQRAATGNEDVSDLHPAANAVRLAFREISREHLPNA